MTPDDFILPERAKILVIVCRRLGDVLLATPLLRSLRTAWPEAEIDVLVFAGTSGILDGNPDLDRIITMPEQPTFAQSFALSRRLWRRYALAVSTQTGDRPTYFAFAAGRRRIGPVDSGSGAWLRRLVLHRSVPARAVGEAIHRVEEVLLLADALGIARAHDIVAPQAATPGLQPVGGGPYAVVHAAPMFRYKQWKLDGWRQLAASLIERGLAIVATGAPGDRCYLDEVWAGREVLRLDGKMSWPEIAGLLAGARVYVGPDTSVTHLAAAAGCATVALYGPTDPRRWGPWPVGGLGRPWAAAERIQRRGNVWLVQNPLPCTPCQKEGCERHLNSYSQCLDELSTHQVLAAVDQALAARKTSSPLASSA
jgi:lipopolysaccharide heptosyltransferase III